MTNIVTPPLDLATESEAFQVQLEGHRLNPDDEQLYEDYLKAKARVETAWLIATGCLEVV